MELRPAKPSDALAVAKVHVRSWQAAYRNLLPDDYLDALRPEDRVARYDFATRDPENPQTLLAVEGDRVVGFATTGPARGIDVADSGELMALHIDPDCRGKGIGLALITSARARLAALGFSKAILWVLAGNLQAQRFYRINGWETDEMRRLDVSRGVEVEEVRYRCRLI